MTRGFISITTTLALFMILNGCSSAESPLPRLVAKAGGNSADETPVAISQPANETPEAADDSESVAEPVPVGGAYLVCEIDLNTVVPAGTSAVGCLVRDRTTNATIAFAPDYMSKLDLATAGVPITDIAVVDSTATPNPYHWRFSITNDRLVGSSATATLTSRTYPDRVTMLTTNLPPFSGTEIRTRLGFNFDDTGADGTGDKDFNDVLLCMQGVFRLSLTDKLLVSQIAQTATLTYQKNADCRQDIEVQYTTPGSNTINIFLDTVTTAQKNQTFSFDQGTRVQVKFKSAAPCRSENIDLFNNASVRLRAESCGRMP